MSVTEQQLEDALYEELDYPFRCTRCHLEAWERWSVSSIVNLCPSCFDSISTASAEPYEDHYSMNDDSDFVPIAFSEHPVNLDDFFNDVEEVDLEDMLSECGTPRK